VGRVALVAEPPDGGVAEHVAHLALGLRERGWEPTVFVSHTFAPRPRLTDAGVDVQPLPFRRDYAHPLHDAAALSALTRRVGRFDLVHAHAAKAGALGRVAAALRGVACVYTPHCFPFVGEVTAARRHATTAAERALARVTETIVCVCEAERRAAIAHRIAVGGRLEVVLNGCPPCSEGDVDPAVGALQARGPVVAAVASLRRQKRLDVLVDAAPLIRAAVPTAQVAIVGDGPEAARLLERDASLGGHVTFLPFVPPSSRALRALDVYVLPSGWEALPIGILEAQACGVPQVVTDVGGNREAVTADTGVVVPPGDPRALAAAVVGILRDRERRTVMAEASRRRHAAAFTVDRMCDATAAVYADVSMRRAPRSRPGRSPAGS
jgi:glycosyltransferase involved in cell wall biosynthesis